MKYLSLFSGIEAATVACKALGFEPVAFAEFEDFPKAVLAHHYPNVPDLGDVTKITREQIRALGHIDIVVGGSPCQDLSLAGKRAGLRKSPNDIIGEFEIIDDSEDDLTRSGLFVHQMRIFEIAREECGARYMLWENVPGAFSSNGGNDFAYILGSMVGRSVYTPTDGWKNSGVCLSEDGGRIVEWRVLDAQYFGVPQRRRRIFALLDTGAWWSRSPFLFEQDCMLGHIAQGGLEGEGASEGAEGSSGSGSAYAAMTGQTGSNGLGISKEIAYTLNCAKDQAVMAFDTTQITSPDNGSHPKPGAPCHPLASQAHPPTVIYENHAQGSRVTRCEDGVAPTITSRMGTGGGNLPFVLAPPPDRMEILYPKVVGALLARDYKGIGRADTWNRMIVTRESQAE